MGKGPRGLAGRAGLTEASAITKRAGAGAPEEPVAAGHEWIAAPDREALSRPTATALVATGVLVATVVLVAAAVLVPLAGSGATALSGALFAGGGSAGTLVAGSKGGVSGPMN